MKSEKRKAKGEGSIWQRPFRSSLFVLRSSSPKAWLLETRIRLRAWFRGRRVGQEIDAELAYHLDMRTRELVESGMSPARARRAALNRFGDFNRTRVECHQLEMVEPTHAGDGLMSEFLRDIRYTLRSLTRNPGFAAIVVATIGLGIGANSAIFSVVDGVLLRPLPYEEPEDLYMVWENDRLRGTTQEGFSGPDFFDVVERNRVFTDMTAYNSPSYTLTGVDGEPQRVNATASTYNLFSVLGVGPMLGRGFVSEEGEPGGESVVVLSHQLWASRFGSDESILGRLLDLDGTSYRVVGVMGPGFAFPRPSTELWIPSQMTSTNTFRGNHGFAVVARARDDATVDRINGDLTTIAAALEEEFAVENLGRGMWAETVYQSLVGDVRPALLVLLGAVFVVLLIACVNVANLLFARGSAREREVAIRVAMGAGRGRLVRQLLTESVVLAGIGGLMGIALAVVGVKVLIALGPSNLPRLSNIGVDLRVLGFTGLISGLTGVLFGVVPALQSSNPDLQAPLREGGRGGSAGVAKHRLRRVLVVTEVAMAVVLVTAAGLLIKSFWRLQQVDMGFNASGVLSVGVQLPAARYPQNRATWPVWPEVRGFQRQMQESIASLPGVESAALALNNPTSAGWTTRLTIEGRPAVFEGEQDEVRIRVISPAYLDVVGLPLVRGRPLTDADDRTDAPPVALINEALANKYFPDEDPIGQRVTNWNVTREIVGVVRDVRFLGPSQEAQPALYPTFSQMPFTGFALLVRTTGDPLAMLPSVRAEILAMDRDLAFADISSLEGLLESAVSQPRFNMLLLSVFAFVALALAAVGIYGVIAYGVSQRIHEIGVRMSLGAKSADVVRQIVVQGMRLTGVGIVIGIVGAFWATRLLSTMLFGVGTFDLGTFTAVALVAAGVALVASCIPALRASKIDPVEALRYE